MYYTHPALFCAQHYTCSFFFNLPCSGLDPSVSVSKYLFSCGGRVNCLHVYSSSLSLSVVSGQPVVKVLSPEDGKQSIVEAARRFCRTVEQKMKTSKDIDVPMFDALLRGELEPQVFIRDVHPSSAKGAVCTIEGHLAKWICQKLNIISMF